MNKIAVITSTRAEYGLLLPVIKELRKKENDTLKIDLIVTGTHLSNQYGMTINDIEERIDYSIPISVKSDTELDISDNQSDALIKFTKIFMKEGYKAVLLLGDRYETFAIAIAAGNTLTPIFHLCGGDTTEGAIDEWIRHSITKISYLHFVTNDISKKRVIQLGEDPNRVFNYGSTSIDNIISETYVKKVPLLECIGLNDCEYALCTFHPETMTNGNIHDQVNEIILAIKSFPNIQFIVTKSNADMGGARINDIFDKAGKKYENIHVYSSLGIGKYLSLMKYAKFVLGNSSSGIIEAPAFCVPTVNVGDRQKGRLQPESVINCKLDKNSIIDSILKAMSEEHLSICKNVTNPYGDGHAAERIANKTIETVISGNINLRKSFYNIY